MNKPRVPGETEDPSSANPSNPAIGDRTVSIPSGAIPLPPLSKDHPGLVVIQGTEIGRAYRLRRKKSILGRGEEAEIRIPDDRISRQHASLEVIWDAALQAQRVFLSDLGSTNKTYLNGKAIRRDELKEGDKVRVGGTILKFVLQDDLDARFHTEVRNLIAYDRLTGLLAKESLRVALEAELKRCLKYRLPLSVLMMDLDHFKKVNDSEGHLMGSHVLAEVGRIIREGFRSTDVSARYGGEEFLAYLSEAPIPVARLAGERIRSAVEEHSFRRFEETGTMRTVRITISIGISQAPLHGSTYESLVGAADVALYRAKSEGRNRVCLAV